MYSSKKENSDIGAGFDGTESENQVQVDNKKTEVEAFDDNYIQNNEIEPPKTKNEVVNSAQSNQNEKKTQIVILGV